MIPRSTAIAIVAVLLSLAVHFLGLGMTTRAQLQQPEEDVSTNVVSLGRAFEDVAETRAQPVEPERAPVPEPDSEPVPEPERADTPTSQALVASDNPQQVASPDTGSAPVVQPETTGPSEPALGDVPEPTTIEPSNGSGNEIAEAPVAPPDGTDTATEVPEGSPEGGLVRLEAVPVESLPTPPVVSTPQRLAALPSAVPVTPLEAETVDPEDQLTPVEPEPADVQNPIDEDDTAVSETRVTTSLRPRLRTPRQSSGPEGLANGTPELRDTRLAPAQTIESPLTAYQRDGTNVFAGQSGGTRSGGIGFRNSSGPGNSDVTNYAGQVLVHLNRVRPIAVSGKGWARVFFEINPDGTLASVDIIDGVGSPEIERAAKAQVRNGVPFPRPPGGRSRKLNFVYRIQ
ncbi:MAG: TonB family protein [Paracoccaceae bacterium]|nr:TonB family protein [Paracoccaceae bacterium]